MMWSEIEEILVNLKDNMEILGVSHESDGTLVQEYEQVCRCLHLIDKRHKLAESREVERVADPMDIAHRHKEYLLENE